MKKISITMWIILAGIFLYTATLWQRPLFVFEFPDAGILTDLSQEKILFPLSRHLDLFILKNAGGVPFWGRIFTALLTLLAGGSIFLAGRKSSLAGSAGGGGSLIFLLMPVVFLAGTSASPALQHGAWLTITLFSLFAFAESTTRREALIRGTGATLVLTGMTAFFMAPLLYLTALTILLIYLFLCRIFVLREKKTVCYWSLLAFVPGAFLLSGTTWNSLFILPGQAELKNLAALFSAGCFPWIIFVPFLLKNFRSRLQELLNEPFALFALIVFLTSLAGAFFTSGACGLFVAALAGLAILTAAFMEMEHLENGPKFFNIILWVLAIMYFASALFLGSFAALTLYTRLLDPAWKIFSARDGWALTALVPVVSGIWFITAAGEKLSKERKFLASCAGVAFVLLAFHGLVPLKIVENNAPVKFLQQAVVPRLPVSAPVYCDKALLVPAGVLFKTSTLKQLPSFDNLGEIKAAAKAKKSFCVLTLSRKISDALPFPKTTVRSGRFTAVFYNIDFPEMRTRKL